jgi:hypothetical protein
MAEMQNSVKTAWFPTIGNPNPKLWLSSLQNYPKLINGIRKINWRIEKRKRNKITLNVSLGM